MVVNLTVAQPAEQPVDVRVGNRPTQANFIRVGQGHQHGGLVRDDLEMVKPASRPEDCLFFDALDDAKSMIRVNDLVTNQESHESPVRK